MLRACRVDRLKASGAGGQHRNKVETGVRLTHVESGVSAMATEDRSLQTNQARGLRRLRHRLAETVRSPLADPLPAEFVRYRTSEGRLAINERNRDHPIVLAVILDGLTEAGSVKGAGDRLGLTSSQILKFLRDARVGLLSFADSPMLTGDSAGGGPRD